MRKALALLMMTGSDVKAAEDSDDLPLEEVVLGSGVEGVIKYEVQPRSSKASRTSDARQDSK